MSVAISASTEESENQSIQNINVIFSYFKRVKNNRSAVQLDYGIMYIIARKCDALSFFFCLGSNRQTMILKTTTKYVYTSYLNMMFDLLEKTESG